MPRVTIQLVEGRTMEQKRALVKKSYRCNRRNPQRTPRKRNHLRRGNEGHGIRKSREVLERTVTTKRQKAMR